MGFQGSGLRGRFRAKGLGGKACKLGFSLEAFEVPPSALGICWDSVLSQDEC